MNFKRIGKIWKELDQTKRMRPTGTFFDHPFRSYSSLKMKCLKIKCKNHSNLDYLCFETLFSNCCNFLTDGRKRSRLVAFSLSYRVLSRTHLFFSNFIHMELHSNNSSNSDAFIVTSMVWQYGLKYSPFRASGQKRFAGKSFEPTFFIWKGILK
jgi:hypothetical protein